MQPTHERLIILSDTRIKVQGDFGGGYEGNLPSRDNKQARFDVIARALMYLPGAKLVNATEEERQHFGQGETS